MKFLYIFLIVIVVIGLCLLAYALVEPFLLKIKREEIDLSGEDNKNPNTLKLFYFSDLHAEYCRVKDDKLCDIILEAYKKDGLDAVIFGGDICNNPGKYQKGANYLNKIALVCKQLDIPFLGTNGNHDIGLSAKELEACSFNNISDKNYIYTKGSMTVRFSGVSDSGRKPRVWREVPEYSGNYDMHILLAHNPDQILYLSKDLPDVMLSGHIHGGQIRTPFGIEFKVLRKDELPRKGIISGVNEVCGRKVYISQGLGCVLMPLRLGARPDVTILTIKK